MMERADRQLISACRNLLAEYEPVLEAIRTEIDAAEDSTPLTGADAFEIARKAIRRDAVKEGMKSFIAKIKNYGNQRPE
jgi:hypothetical protein